MNTIAADVEWLEQRREEGLIPVAWYDVASNAVAARIKPAEEASWTDKAYDWLMLYWQDGRGWLHPPKIIGFDLYLSELTLPHEFLASQGSQPARLGDFLAEMGRKNKDMFYDCEGVAEVAKTVGLIDLTELCKRFS